LPVLENNANDLKEEKLLMWHECINPAWEELRLLHEKVDFVIDDPAYLLHNTFFHLTHIAPRDIFVFKDEHVPVFPAGTTSVGIHTRGGDIRGADGNNGREIHSSQYYKDAIDLIQATHKNIIYYVCTDDYTFPSYIDTIKYLSLNGLSFKRGDIGNQFKDFSILSACDIIIASSSTFAVCAGFVGKKDKKIIHSFEWLHKNFGGAHYWKWGNYTEQYPEAYWRAYDNFWIDLYKGENEYYSVWKFV
jgi:hypothetical protein